MQIPNLFPTNHMLLLSFEIMEVTHQNRLAAGDFAGKAQSLGNDARKITSM
jgi:hypothetical protein